MFCGFEFVFKYNCLSFWFVPDLLVDAKCEKEPAKKAEQIVEQDDLMLEDIINDDDGGMGRRKKPKSTKRVKWSKKEEEEIFKSFAKYFSGEIKKTCPSKSHCMAAIAHSQEAQGDLHKRDWETLKKKVSNMLKKRNC